MVCCPSSYALHTCVLDAPLSTVCCSYSHGIEAEQHGPLVRQTHTPITYSEACLYLHCSQWPLGHPSGRSVQTTEQGIHPRSVVATHSLALNADEVQACGQGEVRVLNSLDGVRLQRRPAPCHTSLPPHGAWCLTEVLPGARLFAGGMSRE